MTETIETIFGNNETNTPQKITDELVAGLIDLRDEFSVTSDLLKEQYVALVNNPKVQEQGEAKYLVAFRALRAQYNGLYAQGSGRNVLFMPFSVNSKPQVDKKKGGFVVRAYGLVLSPDPDYKLVGAIDIRYGGFSSELTAQAFAKSLTPGVVYKQRINLSSQSKLGELTGGEAAFGFADGTRVLEPTDAATDQWWRQSYHHLAATYPNITPVAELLQAPKPNVVYHVQAEVSRGRTGVDATTSRPNGSIVISDLSVSGALAKEHGGGLFTFLPAQYVSAGNLPAGSGVDVLLTGYLKAKKDKSGAQTGESAWQWNVLGLERSVDLTMGNTVPDPAAPAVTIPPKAAPQPLRL